MGLLWIAGATASGKDTLIDGVLLPLGFVSIKTSSMLRQAIPVFYPDMQEDVDALSPVRLNELGTGIREIHGQDYFTQLAIHQETAWKHKVINGLRRWEEFDAIHANNGMVILIISSVEEAVKRVVEIRKRSIDKNIDVATISKHIDREKTELDRLLPKADLVLVNDFLTKSGFVDFSRQRIVEFLG